MGGRAAGPPGPLGSAVRIDVAEDMERLTREVECLAKGAVGNGGTTSERPLARHGPVLGGRAVKTPDRVRGKSFRFPTTKLVPADSAE